MREDWLPILLGDGSPNWLNLPGDPRARLVKENDGRQVWRVELGSQVVFAKVGRPAWRWGRLRQLLFGSDASREQRAARYAADHHIHAVSPVATAQRRANGCRASSILITDGLTEAAPLDRFWAELDSARPGTRAIKNRVIDAVARLIAHAHQNGFRHADLHAGNVLISLRGDGSYHAMFVDLNNVRLGRTVRRRAVVRNLAQFNQWFALRGSLTDRVRFLNRYLYWREVVRQESSHPCLLGVDRRVLVRWIERAAARHAQTLYAQRDRRTTRDGRYFAKLKLGAGWRAHVFLQAKEPVATSRASQIKFSAAQWKKWLQQPLDLLHPDDRRLVIKESRSALVCRAEVPVDGGPALPVVCKRAAARNLFKRITHSIRSSRSIRNWKLANALLNRRIPTARPLAVLEQRRFGLLRDSIIVTELIEQAHDLDTVLTVHIRELSAAGQRRLKEQITEALLGLLRRMHARDVTHRDFKPPNILVQWDPRADEKPRVLVVDLDGVSPGRNGSIRTGLRMLMRLNVGLDHCRRVTRTDRLRFLKAYLEHPWRPSRPWKPIWRELTRQCERKRKVRARHQARKIKKYGCL